MNGVIARAQRSVVGRFATCWGQQRAGEGAILIAWQLLFSLFPLMVGILAILGLVLRDPRRQTAIVDQIVGLFPEQAGDLLGFIGETRDLGGIFGIVSVLGLLWSGSNLFGTMETVFDRFYAAEPRGFVRQRLMSFTMMAVYTVLIVVSVSATSITGFLSGLSDELLPFEVPYVAFALGWVLAVASAMLMFLVLYRFVPNARLRVWHVWKGAILAGGAFVLLTQAFPLYLHFLGTGFAAYKALGVFLLLMTWFYFLGMILCAGALLNALLTGHARPQPATGSDGQRQQPASPRRATPRRGRQRSGAAPETGTLGKLAQGIIALAAFTALVPLARRAAGLVWRSVTGQPPPG